MNYLIVLFKNKVKKKIIKKFKTSNRANNFYESLLVDSNNNYVHSNYTNLLDEPPETYLFRMTSRYQIEYLGKVEKVDYPLYNFDDLYKENYQSTKDVYWLNTLFFLKGIEPSKFYNIVNVEYQEKHESETEITLEKTKITLKEYSKFLKNFLKY